MKIAVVGASGLVGRKILELLDSLNEKHEIIAYSSSKSAGQKIKNHTLIELNENNLQKVDFALFSAGGAVSKLWAEKFTNLGSVVIDNSNAFRREKTVPLVVPEINAESINCSSQIISNPNCSTIQIAIPLFYINKINKIKKVIVSTYQSASGAGQKGLDDLFNNTTNKFPFMLSNNIIPQIDTPLENGYTLEEDKIRFELRKILNHPSLSVCATAVRTPIKNCHGASVYVELEQNVEIEKIKKMLSNSPSIVLKDNIKNLQYPMPSDAHNTDYVFVGRIRPDLDNPKAFNFWCVADNLRVGASTNALNILKYLTKKIK